jgi:carboxymethylenebutenolidase
LDYLKTVQAVAAGRIAIAGYCKGGIYAFMAAARFAEIKALLIFHGFAYRQLDADHALQPIDLAEKVQVPVTFMHGTEDKSAPLPTMREFDSRLRSLGKRSSLIEYEGAQHGFAVSTHPNYDASVAEKSFQDAQSFLKKELA